MKDYIDCKPVMLPVTGVVSIDHTLWLNAGGRILHTHTSTPEVLQPQHLYLVSEEGSEVDDWTIFTNSSNGKITGFNLPIKAKSPYASNGVYNLKVIATTDKSLSLPLIPNSFIERWVNEQGKIDKVRVLITEAEATGPHPFYSGGKLSAAMIDVTFGEVIILPIEDKTYTEKQVLALMAITVDKVRTVKYAHQSLSYPVARSIFEEEGNKVLEDKTYSREELKEATKQLWTTNNEAFNEWFDKNYPI